MGVVDNPEEPHVDRQREITYMQVRMARCAMRTWDATLGQVSQRFAKYDVTAYIEQNYDLLHLEGDEAVFEDVAAYVNRREAEEHA